MKRRRARVYSKLCSSLLHNGEGRLLRAGLAVRSVYVERDYLFLASSRAAVAASLKSVLVPVAFVTASTFVTS